jgi:hypothetical protein
MGGAGEGEERTLFKGFFLPFPRPPEAQPRPAPGAARRGLVLAATGRAGYFLPDSDLASRM